MAKRDVIIYLAFGIMLVITIINGNKLNELQQRLQMVDSIQHDIQDVSYRVNTVSSQVETKLDEFLQDQLWVPEKGYTVTDVNLQENTINVNIEWRMREQLHDEQLAFLYREKGDTEWRELAVTNTNGLNYLLQQTFPLRGDYEAQLVATSDTGQRSEHLLDLNFKEQLDTRISIHAFLHPLNDARFDMNVDIYNNLENHLMLAENRDDLKIKTATAVLYIDGEAHKEWDLLEENPNFHSDDYSENFNAHHLIDIGAELGEKVNLEQMELRVFVEDGLGLEYEATAELFQ